MARIDVEVAYANDLELVSKGKRDGLVFKFSCPWCEEPVRVTQHRWERTGQECDCGRRWHLEIRAVGVK